MSFDTKAFLAAIDRPTFTHEGKTWTGRLLSVPEYIRMGKMIEPIERGATPAQLLAAFEQITNHIFPPPMRKTRRFWSFWKQTDIRDRSQPSCWDVLSTLPMPVQTAAVMSFINSLVTSSRLNLTAGLAEMGATSTSPETDASSESSTTSIGSSPDSATSTPASGSIKPTEPAME